MSPTLALALALLSAAPSVKADLSGGLTADFQTWLNANGYSQWVTKFVRADLNGHGSYGGKTSSGQKVTHQPVIFIHGNSDQALNAQNSNPYQTGWDDSINYFLGQGYTSAELYATTWGPADPQQAIYNTHSCEYVQQLRAFVEAVLRYTGAAKVDIIGHSMGVTLGRKVIKGGSMTDQDGSSCDIGAALTSKVDTFVGIAGANRGLAGCFGTGDYPPTCNSVNGFFPGYGCGFSCTVGKAPSSLSGFLADLYASQAYEGSYVYALWSSADDVILYGDIVWSQPTSQIPNQTGQRKYTNLGHMALKETTADVQYNAVVNHSI